MSEATEPVVIQPNFDTPLDESKIPIPKSFTSVKLDIELIKNAIGSTASASKHANYDNIYLAFNPGNEKTGLNVIGGNHKNLVIINATGNRKIDADVNLAVFPYRYNQLANMVRNLNIDKITCTFNFESTTGLLTISDAETTFTLNKTNVSVTWIKKILDPEFKGLVNEEAKEFEVELDNNTITDMKSISSNTIGTNGSPRITSIITDNQMLIIRNSPSTISVLKRDVTAEFPEGTTPDKKIINVQFDTDMISNVVYPFVNSIVANNKMEVYEKFIRIRKTDGSGFCIFSRDKDIKSPFSVFTNIVKKSSKLFEISIDYKNIKGLLDRALSVITDIGISSEIVCDMKAKGEGKMKIDHTTTIASVNSQTTFMHKSYNREDIECTSSVNETQLTINGISLKRISESINFSRSLTDNFKDDNRNTITIGVFRGPYLLNQDGSRNGFDYLKIGKENYYTLLTCENKVETDEYNVSEAVPFKD